MIELSLNGRPRRSVSRPKRNETATSYLLSDFQRIINFNRKVSRRRFKGSVATFEIARRLGILEEITQTAK